MAKDHGKLKGDRRGILFLWRRLVARLLDYSIWLLVCYGLTNAWILRSRPHDLLCLGMDQIAACGLMVLVEPLLLAFLSTSPGRILAGLRVVDLSGRRLTLGQAIIRSFQVWRQGLGFGLPLLRLVRLSRAYAAKREGILLAWEETSSVQPLMTCKEGNHGRS